MGSSISCKVNDSNYVIQHVIERGNPEDREKIIGDIFGQVLELSKHKFASNVVEKCVAFGTFDDRQRIIDEIMEVNVDNSSPLLAMMKDGFGNYVIQKLLDVTEGEQRAQLVAKIKPQLLALKRYTYGKHLASSMSLLYRSKFQLSVFSSWRNHVLDLLLQTLNYRIPLPQLLVSNRQSCRPPPALNCMSFQRHQSNPFHLLIVPNTMHGHSFSSHICTFFSNRQFKMALLYLLLHTNLLLYISPSLIQHVVHETKAG
jgi:hypothetical protein